ncbi:MAG: dihydrofolate reductase [Microgenomates group bacterium]
MKTPIISIVAAIDKNNGIGRGNKMAWRIREDLIRLSNMTRGKIVILGRNSYESMAGYYDVSGKPMPAREYIVVTHQKDFKSSRNNTYTALSIDDALKRANESGEDEVFIIGGAQIFKQTISLADKLYLTLVNKDFGCDTFFPDYNQFSKELYSEKGKSEELEFEYKILVKP